VRTGPLPLDCVIEIVDLGHEIFSNMPTLGAPTTFWSEDRHESLSKLTSGRFSMESRMMLMSEHAGTHIDSPWHSSPQGKSVDELPLEHLMLAGHLLDLRAKRTGDAITVADLEAAAARSGRPIAAGEATLVWTGVDSRWGAPNFTRDRPFVPEATVDWLAKQKIGLFGTDLIQVDDPDEWWYPTHTSLARNGIPMVQQLCALDRLEGKDFVFLVVPLKLRGGTASPVRPIALVTRA
jgi:kynurenine formamidase